MPAADTVRGLDSLRAPLTAAERAARRPERLTRRQRDLLDAWGYPYVLDEFRFHLTLTDDLDGPAGAAAGERLAGEFAEVLGADVPVGRLVTVVEPAPGADFEVLSVHPLSAPEEQR